MGHSGEISQLQPCFTTWSSFALSATLVLASCTTPTALLCPSTLPTRSQLLPIWPPRRTPAHTTTLATTTSESVRLMLTLMLAWCTIPTALLCPLTLPTRSQLLPILAAKAYASPYYHAGYHYLGKREADADADASLVTYPNGAVVP